MRAWIVLIVLLAGCISLGSDEEETTTTILESVISTIPKKTTTTIKIKPIIVHTTLKPTTTTLPTTSLTSTSTTSTTTLDTVECRSNQDCGKPYKQNVCQRGDVYVYTITPTCAKNHCIKKSKVYGEVHGNPAFPEIRCNNGCDGGKCL